MKLTRSALVVALLLYSSWSMAEDGYKLNLGLQDWDPIQVSAANQLKPSQSTMESGKVLDGAYKKRHFTLNKLHQYLGIGSMALAGATLLAPKQDGNSLHHQLGQGAAVVGGLAVLTGLTFHLEDLSWHGGFKDPDNLHALFSTLGTVGYALAVDNAPGGNHAGYGSMGALSMLIGIKLTW